eukprot:3005515-Rhodomonas_salina.1
MSLLMMASISSGSAVLLLSSTRSMPCTMHDMASPGRNPPPAVNWLMFVAGTERASFASLP